MSTLCPAGKYGPVEGASSCIVVLAGTVTSTAGRTAYTTCVPGKYAAANQMTACVPVPIGSYGDSSSATAYTLCAPGYYTSVTSSTVCKIVPAGSYSNSMAVSSEGSTGFIQCPAGKSSGVVAAKNSSTCDSCAVGYFSRAGYSVGLFFAHPPRVFYSFLFSFISFFLSLFYFFFALIEKKYTKLNFFFLNS